MKTIICLLALRKCAALSLLTAALLTNESSVAAQFSFKISALDAPVSVSSNNPSKARGAQSQNISLGEQVSVRLELANEGALPVETRASVDPAAGFVTFYLAGPGARAEPFTVNRWEIKEIRVKPRLVAPGEKLVHETFLYGRMGTDFQESYLFGAQGDYTLHAVYVSQVPLLRLESNTILIHVGPPVAEWEELKKARIVELMEGRLPSPQQEAASMAKVQSLVSRHGQHPLQKWTAAKAKSLAADKEQTP